MAMTDPEMVHCGMTALNALVRRSGGSVKVTADEFEMASIGAGAILSFFSDEDGTLTILVTDGRLT